MEYKVYKISGLDNVVKYIGVTSKSLKERLNKHINDVKTSRTKNLHKKNWFNDNINNLNIELIESYSTIEDCYCAEIYWISYYRNKGINLINKTDGGEGCYGYKHSEETLKKISGSNNHRWGKPNLINKEILGKKIEYSIDGINWILFNSITDAKKKLNISNRTIKNICDGNYVHKSTYFFRYYGDVFKEPRKRNKNNQSIRKKKIEAFIDNNWIVYDSSIDASENLGIDRSKIILVCQGSRLTAGGYKFRYFGSIYKSIQKKSGHPGKYIEFIYNGILYSYNSITQASKELGISRKKIYKLL